ncbi:MAG: LysE family translocator [Opitutales bacterium]|nr:LysE family translocator [Opitutales bacterium]
MNLPTTLSLLAVMLALAAMPSASVGLVVTRSATLGFANGVAVSMGIVLGDLVFVALAILGMGFLAESLGAYFSLLKYAGGVYLIWLGISLIRSRPDVDTDLRQSSRMSLVSSFVAGFVLTLGDVKAILFYASLFPAFVDMTSLTVADIVGIVLVTICAVGGVKLIYAYSAQRIAQSLKKRKIQDLARKVVGCIILGVGAYLIVST